MSLRDLSHQAAIELGECDTEFVSGLKHERAKLLDELAIMRLRRYSTHGGKLRVRTIKQRLVRIQEMLK